MNDALPQWRARAPLLVLFAALSLLGGALLLLPYLRPAPAPGAPAAQSPPADNSKILLLSQFKEKLQPLAAGDDGREAASRFSAAQKDRFGSQSAVLEIDLIRTLEMGQELESDITLLYQAGDPMNRIHVQIQPRIGTPATYLAKVRDGKVSQVQLAAEGHPVRVLEVEDELPVALGDLPMQDGVSFFSMDETHLNPAGWMEDMGSRRMIVFEQVAEPGKGQLRNSPSAAATALVYVEPEHSELRAIRVFDRLNRLARVYDDFQFDKSRPVWRLQSFRVSSPSRGTHTLYRMRRIELDRPVEVPADLGPVGPTPVTEGPARR